MKIEQMIEQHKQMWAAFEKLNEKLEEKQAPYEPKDGEYVYHNFDSGFYMASNVMIFRNINESSIGFYAAICIEYRNCLYMGLKIDNDISRESEKQLRPATPEEKQLLDDKLKEQGKRWNAEKKCIEDIPTWKVGDWFIPHKPKEPTEQPFWTNYMDIFDGKLLKVESIISQGYLWSNDFNFHPDWCEKTEEPKKELKIGDMCIFWDNDKEYAVCALYDGARHDYFMDTTGAMWQNCIPFESVEQYKKFLNEKR